LTPAETPLWPDNPTAEDLLGFRDIAEPIMDALMRDRLDPVAVGVFGDWGSGKSTVLEIIGSDLAPDREDEGGDSEAANKIVVVQTRPWEYDPKVDPKATLIDEVLSAVKAAAEERPREDG
jgi:predicted KAP-like P-loop ATPase